MYGSSVFADEVLRTVEKELTSYMTTEKLDIFAQPLVDTLEENGIASHYVVRNPEAGTGTAMIVIDPSGQNSFLTQLNNGASRQTVALEVLTSKEYYTRLVNQAYVLYLNRAADQSGLNNWVNALLAGSITDQGFYSNLIGSAEYLNNIPTS